MVVIKFYFGFFWGVGLMILKFFIFFNTNLFYENNYYYLKISLKFILEKLFLILKGLVYLMVRGMVLYRGVYIGYL